MPMKRVLLLTVLTWLLSCTIGLTAKEYNVRDFGAVGDGQHIDSPAINAALLKAAQDGGHAVVVVGEGTYLCYSLHLQSGVTLRLEHGATLKAAQPTATEEYDEAEENNSHYQDFGHSHWHNSLLWGENLHDVVLEGDGLIDGSDVLTRGGQRKSDSGQTTANKALALRDCKNVTIRGLRFLSCGHFAMLLTGVDHLLIENTVIDTNRDGIDIDCCQHVVVRGCWVNTVNDDAIVLKCSYALGWPKPTEHVRIEDCKVSGYDVGSVLKGSPTTTTVKAPDGDGPTGRIKLGTESNGGFRHIRIQNCTFTHCRGLALETVDGAEMQDVSVSHITMRDICNSPIYIRLGDRMRAPEGFHPSAVSGIRISDIDADSVDSRYAILIAGIEGHPVSNVTLSDINIRFLGGLTLEDVAQQRNSNPFFFGGNGMATISRHEASGYPEPSAHGIQPAWGLSISHAENIRLRNVNLQTINADERPALFMQNHSHVKFRNVKALNNGQYQLLPSLTSLSHPSDRRSF